MNRIGPGLRMLGPTIARNTFRALAVPLLLPKPAKNVPSGVRQYESSVSSDRAHSGELAVHSPTSTPLTISANMTLRGVSHSSNSIMVQIPQRDALRRFGEHGRGEQCGRRDRQLRRRQQLRRCVRRARRRDERDHRGPLTRSARPVGLVCLLLRACLNSRFSAGPRGASNPEIRTEREDHQL